MQEVVLLFCCKPCCCNWHMTTVSTKNVFLRRRRYYDVIIHCWSLRQITVQLLLLWMCCKLTVKQFHERVADSTQCVLHHCWTVCTTLCFCLTYSLTVANTAAVYQLILMPVANNCHMWYTVFLCRFLWLTIQITAKAVVKPLKVVKCG